MSKSYHTKQFHLSQLRQVREQMKAALPPQVRRRLAEDEEAERELRDWRLRMQPSKGGDITPIQPRKGTQQPLF